MTSHGRRNRPGHPKDPLRQLPRGLDWYVITTNPLREYTVAQWLEERDWFTLVPLEKRWNVDPKVKGKRGGVKHKRVPSLIPILPRMVVVGFHEPPPWFSILEHQHINGVLGVNHVPTPLRAGDPELLRAISHALQTNRPEDAIKPGGRALVTVPGPFQGQVVEVATLKGRKAIISAVFDRFDRKEIPFVMEIMLDDLEAA